MLNPVSIPDENACNHIMFFTIMLCNFTIILLLFGGSGSFTTKLEQRIEQRNVKNLKNN